MRGYIVRRLLASLVAIFIVSVAIAGLVRLTPGDAVIAGIAAAGDVEPDPEAIEEIRKELGLDKHFIAQYWDWISGVFVGDFGNAYSLGNEPVSKLIKNAWPVSIQLAIMAVLVALAFAIPVGTLSAIRQDGAPDYIGRLFAIIGLSVPEFVWATLLIIYLAIWFNYTPPFLYHQFVDNPGANLKMLIIPAVTMGLRFSSSAMRMVRSSTLEVLREDYVRTAWAKGLRERVVIIRHVLKNAFIPVVTTVGTLFGFLLGGSVIVETIFNLPGMGKLVVGGMVDRDYPIVQTIVFFAATVLVVINLLVDLSYGWLDPRIHYA